MDTNWWNLNTSISWHATQKLTFWISVCFYRLKRGLGQGNVFTGFCLSIGERVYVQRGLPRGSASRRGGRSASGVGGVGWADSSPELEKRAVHILLEYFLFVTCEQLLSPLIKFRHPMVFFQHKLQCLRDTWFFMYSDRKYHSTFIFRKIYLDKCSSLLFMIENS